MNERIYYSRDAERRANRDKTIAILLFMALGIGIGAALALLFAPKSGDKIREEIASTLEDRVDSGREASRGTLERLERGILDLGKKFEERFGDR